VLFAKAGRCIPTPRLVCLFGGQIHWVNTARFRGVTLDKRLTWSSPIEQVRKKAAQRLGVLGTLLNRRSGLSVCLSVCPSVRNGVLLYKQLILPTMDYACPIMKSAEKNILGFCMCFSPGVFALLPVHLDTFVTGKFKRIWDFHSLPTTSEIRLKVSWCGEPLS